MRVFLSYAVGPVDASIAARLRAVAAAYDVAILLPDRTVSPTNGLTSDTLKKIKMFVPSFAVGASHILLSSILRSVHI
jgi:hypothetical protein